MTKQLNFFESSEEVKKNTSWRLYIDGASRNNPGKSGAGFVLYAQDGKKVFEQGFYLGIKTNNQAEYFALLLGVFFTQFYIQPGDTLRVVSDSQLLVKQMQGVYKVKDQTLFQIKQIVVEIMKRYKAQFEHVLRANNVQADAMANYGIDKKIAPPKKFFDFLSSCNPGLLWD